MVLRINNTNYISLLMKPPIGGLQGGNGINVFETDAGRIGNFDLL